jgi:hypothetical protein
VGQLYFTILDIKKKVKLCALHHHSIQMGAWEERPPHILNFKITWQWSDSCSSSFIFKQTATDTHLIEGWLYPRTCMEVVVKRKGLSLAWQKHNSPAHSD